jgi:hypothetical protein
VAHNDGYQRSGEQADRLHPQAIDTIRDDKH